MSWEALKSIDVQIELCEEYELVLSSLQRINIVDLVLSELDVLKHLAVRETF